MNRCKGMNCGCTDGVSHSLECHAEHAASIAGGVFVKSEQPAASKPEPRKRLVDCGECATGCAEGHCRKYPSKPEPQSTTPKCIGYLDKFGNFKRKLPAWMTDEPGVNWHAVTYLQECREAM